MAEAENIAVVRQVYEEVFDKKGLDLADTIFAPTFKNHAAPPGMQVGPEGVKALVSMLFDVFPDDRHDIEDIFASGDRVAVRVLHHGTHEGTYFGLPASGRHVSQEEMHIFRLEDGRLAEHWGVRDDLGFRRQMASPEPEAAHA
jgi:steroid delta-isomerase-like uncharacterized protein